MHILTYISRSKGDRAMKIGHLIEYNIRNIFLEKSYVKNWKIEKLINEKFINCFFGESRAENGAERLVAGVLLFFGKALCEVKAINWSYYQAACFKYIAIVLNWAYNKKQVTWNLRLLIQRYAQFWFFRKIFVCKTNYFWRDQSTAWANVY